MASILKHTCIIIVTYNERYDFVDKSLDRISDLGFSSAIIFDNNDLGRVRCIDHNRMTVWQLGKRGNEGTATAFSESLAFSIGKGFKFAFLLDDDNLIEESTVTALSHCIIELNDKSLEGFAISCSRDQFNEHSFWLPKTNMSKYVNVSILGGTNARPKTEPGRLLAISNAPYGGLFLDLGLIMKVGLPRRDYVLYVDDIDFTSRISQMSRALYLCSDAWIRDVEPQGIPRTMNGISTVRLAELRRVRSYYAIRNQVHFDKHNYGSYMLFRTNSILFVVKAVLSSLFRDRSVAHLRAVLAALFDGEKGRLGLNKDYPL